MQKHVTNILDEVGQITRTEYYIASEVDAHEAQSVAVIKAQREKIAQLEKALRTVCIIDLGFGVPKYFCAGCVSYGGGPESIAHKDDCIVVRSLSLMVGSSK